MSVIEKLGDAFCFFYIFTLFYFIAVVKANSKQTCSKYCDEPKRRGDNEEEYVLDCVDLYKRYQKMDPFIHCLDMCFYCRWDTGQNCGVPEDNTKHFFQKLIDHNWDLTALNRTNTTQALKLHCPEKREADNDGLYAFAIFIVIVVVMLGSAIGIYYIIFKYKVRLKRLIRGEEPISGEAYNENVESVHARKSDSFAVFNDEVPETDYANLNVAPPEVDPQPTMSKDNYYSQATGSTLSPEKELAIEELKEKIKRWWKDLMWIELGCSIFVVIVIIYMSITDIVDKDPEDETKAATDSNYARMKIKEGCYNTFKLGSGANHTKVPIGDVC